MSAPDKERIQQVLAAEDSPLRDELFALVFDAVAGQPLSVLLADPQLPSMIFSAIDEANASATSEHVVLPAIARFQAHFAEAKDTVGDAVPEAQREQLAKLIASGKGPRLRWMAGAIDGADVRELVAPVVTQVLMSFTSKLPVPGVAGQGGSGGSGGRGIGGLAGRLGKQMSKSAGQFAGVAGSVMGGLGAELERRAQGIARDFSQTAISEFRTAMAERLKSDEGRAIVRRIRDGAVEHAMQASIADVVEDLMRLPIEGIADMAPPVVAHNMERELVRTLVEGEIAALLEAHGTRSLRQLLEDTGQWQAARTLAGRAVDPGLQQLFASDAFGDWLGRLLES